MVRFRVIKGSRLLLGIALVALALVICLIAFQYAARSSEEDASLTGSSLVRQEEAETALAVFASSVDPAPDPIEITILEPDGDGQAPEESPEVESEVDENEHTDESIAPVDLDPSMIDSELKEKTSTPRVLIYHTHTHEAYEQISEDPYVAVEAWRTTDEAHSVVRVGAELASMLRTRGIEVTHDLTDHELNELSTAYVRSLETLERYEEPFDLYIDLHRDAYVEGTGPIALSSNEVEYAKLMMLIGKGENFEQKPYYTENYAFAAALTEQLNEITPGICRDVLVKTNRYNQHIGIYSILIEVGNNRNTLEQSLNSMPTLADALDLLLSNSSENALGNGRINYMS